MFKNVIIRLQNTMKKKTVTDQGNFLQISRVSLSFSNQAILASSMQCSIRELVKFTSNRNKAPVICLH